jgi:hypothetical protein
VQHGEHRIVDPKPYVEAAFRNPPWRRRDLISA